MRTGAEHRDGKEGGWQTIETAPRDFKPILSWDGAQMAVIAYDARAKEWLLLEGANEAHAECPIEWEATHWMPLPLPPIQESQAKADVEATPTAINGAAEGQPEAQADGPDGAESASRLGARRSASATSENGRDSAERRAPSASGGAP